MITLMEGHSVLAALGIWSTPRIRPKYSETPEIYENISKKSRSVTEMDLWKSCERSDCVEHYSTVKSSCLTRAEMDGSPFSPAGSKVQDMDSCAASRIESLRMIGRGRMDCR